MAFIGISNWALDPAKMNRGVMVTRGDPDEKELEISARYFTWFCCLNRGGYLSTCYFPFAEASVLITKMTQ